MRHLSVAALVFLSIGFSTAYAVTKQVYININEVFVPDEVKSSTKYVFWRTWPLT